MDIILEKDPGVVMIDDYFAEVNTRQNGHGSFFRTYNGQFFGPPLNAGDTYEQSITGSPTTLPTAVQSGYGDLLTGSREGLFRGFEQAAGVPAANGYVPPATVLIAPQRAFGHVQWATPSNVGDPMYAQYTPPYFYGKSRVTIEYEADLDDANGNFSFSKLFSRMTASYTNPESFIN